MRHQREKTTRIPSFIYTNPSERCTGVADRKKDVLIVLKVLRATRKKKKKTTNPRVTRMGESKLGESRTHRDGNPKKSLAKI